MQILTERKFYHEQTKGQSLKIFDNVILAEADDIETSGST